MVFFQRLVCCNLQFIHCMFDYARPSQTFPSTNPVQWWLHSDVLGRSSRKKHTACHDNERLYYHAPLFVIAVYWLTHLLTYSIRVFLEKLTGSQLVKTFHAFYGTRRFITAFTSSHHLALSWVTKGSVQVRGFCEWYVTRYIFLRWGVVSTSPKPQAEGPPLVCCPRLAILYIRRCPPYRMTFLHPQPEYAPCRGDRATTAIFSPF
jgi:hypothetical protein